MILFCKSDHGGTGFPDWVFSPVWGFPSRGFSAHRHCNGFFRQSEDVVTTGLPAMTSGGSRCERFSLLYPKRERCRVMQCERHLAESGDNGPPVPLVQVY
jgi:hypothetical protein